jgi:topoisomerase-4 subunit B
LMKDQKIFQMLEYYMGKNTPERQKHIVQNLRIELDITEDKKPTDPEELVA